MYLADTAYLAVAMDLSVAMYLAVAVYLVVAHGSASPMTGLVSTCRSLLMDRPRSLTKTALVRNIF